MCKDKIAVVLVTFNRLDKLKQAVEYYEQQTYPIQEVVIVDNHSTDGTIQYLKEWVNGKGNFKRKTVLLNENCGGAGGFGAGMDEVLDEGRRHELDADWVAVADDDAFPRKNSFEKIIDYYKSLSDKEQEDISVLCSRVVNCGKTHINHRNRIKQSILRARFMAVPEEEYDKDAFDIDIFSYVGTFIKVNALQKVGTTNRDLFIYGDDQEHSLRLRKVGRMQCVPSSVYDHDRPGLGERKIGWHSYYDSRNHVYILKKYFPIQCLIMRCIKRYILDMSVFSSNTQQERKLFKTAYMDGIKGNLGKNSVYKPGFEITDRKD